MSLWLAALITLVGLGILAWSGDKLVEGSVALAKRLNVSEVIIGIIIIGFGTSLPEVMATVSAARIGENDLALGNIVGSNIANVSFVLGVALILTTAASNMVNNQKDYITMLAILTIFSLSLLSLGQFSVMGGLALLASLGLYLAFSVKRALKTPPPPLADGHIHMSWIILIALILGGLIGLGIGAELLIRGATSLATHLGVSEKVIGITIVAIGTSLPELAAAIAAVRKGSLTLTVGNILGSNVFNVLAATGASALFTPISAEGFASDLAVMIGVAILIAPLFFKKSRIPLPALGVLSVSVYCVYILFLVTKGM